MKRQLIFLYGLFSYGLFFVTFLYAMGFVSNFFVPVSIDSAPGLPFAQALLINLGLLTLFAVQHSLMARKFFKQWLQRYIPVAAERSTFVLVSSLALALLMMFWEPMGGVVWDIKPQWARCSLHSLALLGWMTVLYSSFLINHFDLFGLRQVWLNLRQRPHTALTFGTPMLYRLCRHPLYLGFMVAFWATPVMTIAHLVFALGCTAYILGAVRLEERDLVAEHPEYVDYQNSTPMILPLGRKISSVKTAGHSAS